MIKVEGVSKVFSNKKAVDNLSFSIKEGEVYGILGPNGAGKTTTFRMITTFLSCDQGSIKIYGKEISRNRNDIKKEIGMVSQHFSIQSEMTVREILELHGKLHRIPKNIRRQRIDELLEFADLIPHQDKLTKTLSGGMKRKLMILRSVMHRPSILFLDEPTVGLDPLSRRQIWALMTSLQRQKMTIVMTTHYIEEAEKLCDRVMLLDQGIKIDEGSPKALIDGIGKYTVEYYEKDLEKFDFFNTYDDAIDYSKSLGLEVNIRQCNLEDVFLKTMNKRVD